MGFQPIPLCRQNRRAIRPIVGYTAVNPNLFLSHHATSMQKSFIFQMTST